MNDLYKRLVTLRVADVMSDKVVEVSAHASMEDAADRLVEHQISGAPVVDEAGRCVGILSAFDFVRRTGSAGQEEADESHEWRRPAEGGDRHLESIDMRVANYMSSAIQTIDAHASALAAARVMCGEHIHRVVVLDAGGRPLGMLTALDLVAALVNAVEEFQPH